MKFRTLASSMSLAAVLMVGGGMLTGCGDNSASDKADNAKNDVKDAAHDAKNDVKDAAHDAKNAVKDAAH